MSFHRSRWIAKTRKPHYCDWCNKMIEPGSSAQYNSGVFEGDFFSGHRHPECSAACDSLPYYDLANGWSPGDFSRGRTDDKKLPPVFSADYRGKQKEESK